MARRVEALSKKFKFTFVNSTDMSGNRGDKEPRADQEELARKSVVSQQYRRKQSLQSGPTHDQGCSGGLRVGASSSCWSPSIIAGTLKIINTIKTNTIKTKACPCPCPCPKTCPKKGFLYQTRNQIDRGLLLKQFKVVGRYRWKTLNKDC